MGVNKLLSPLGGRPLVRYAVEAAAMSRASPVIVVTGYAAAEVAAAVAGIDVEIVENKDHANGLSASLKCGVRHVPPVCNGAVILLADMPFVAPMLIDALIEAFEPAPGREICVPVRARRRGNPVLWGRRFFPEMMALTGDEGAKRLLATHEDTLYQLETEDDGAFTDIDTPEDLLRAGRRTA